jgi:hypothetical protein
MFQAVPARQLSRRLELLASVHFLLRTRQANETDIAGLREVLLRNDKDFTEDDISQGIKELKQHDLYQPAGPR